MVLFRLGWLTVLSSMYIVEQELYFLVRRPGDICYRSDNISEGKKRQNASQKRVRADLSLT